MSVAKLRPRDRMWQIGLLTLAVLAFVELAGSVIVAHVVDGYSGVSSTSTVGAFADRIDAVRAGTPASRAGLRAGDIVDLAAMSGGDRVEWRDYLIYGRHYDLPIVDHGKRTLHTIDVDENVAESPTWRAIRWNFYVRFAGEALLLAVAGLLAWRRPETPEVRLLSALIIVFLIGDSFSAESAWSTVFPMLDTVAWSIGPCIAFAGLALLATYALRFGGPVSRGRRLLTAITYAVVPLAALPNVVGTVGFYAGRIDNDFGFFENPMLGAFVGIAPFLAPLACALAAVAAARGGERSRIAWATGSLAMLYAGPAVSDAIASASVGDSQLFWTIHNVPYFVAAVGLSYALLQRRLLDIGFVLNRAAVFTTVSFVVVGTFILVEWALGGWLAAASKTTNTIVSAAISLALGFSIYPIHHRVDRIIDAVLFRKRHRAERELRLFAEECGFMTDATLLLERATHVLQRATECSTVHFALHDGVSQFGCVDENDPTIVTLRSSHRMQRLGTGESAFHGELAFPMSARGRLVGILVLGPKHLGETYAPDECDSIAHLARGVGTSLDSLEAHGGLEARTTLEMLVASQRAMTASIERLERSVATLAAGAAHEGAADRVR